MPKFEEQIVSAIQGRNPLIYLHTPEEGRVNEILSALVPKCFHGGTTTTWSCVRGFEPAVEGADTRNPLAALQYILARPRRGFYLMNDLADFLDDPRVLRALREIYFAFSRNFHAAIVITSPKPAAFETLEKELREVELDAPTGDEMLSRLTAIEKQFPGLPLPPGLKAQAVLALRGITLTEADHILYRVFSSGTDRSRLLEEIFTEKGMLAKKSGFLEFVPLRLDTSAVGGMENVKIWAEQRKNLFNQETVDAGVPIPKGVLIMGVSGCGKSLMAKAIAGLWHVPLFRLNMSLVFSGAYGSPQSAFHRALATIEAMAPAVLWIDEMESSLSTPKEAATPQSMVFSEFLTWMQEKPPLVFVAATANRIEMLPAEIIRKGRFDQVFFCDLPEEKERKQIFRIHIERNGANPDEIDIDRLMACTIGWSGAEIEQAVIAARIEAYQAKRQMTTDDIWQCTYTMVPLSKTMAEQVKAIRDWAFKRAMPAARREENYG
jgi:hypothetical protein